MMMMEKCTGRMNQCNIVTIATRVTGMTKLLPRL